MSIFEYRGYIISPCKKMPTSYNVATQGQGGKIPKILEYLFTSTNIAKEFIDEYLKTRVEKESKNGKASSESGG